MSNFIGKFYMRNGGIADIKKEILVANLLLGDILIAEEKILTVWDAKIGSHIGSSQYDLMRRAESVMPINRKDKEARLLDLMGRAKLYLIAYALFLRQENRLEHREEVDDIIEEINKEVLGVS